MRGKILAERFRGSAQSTNMDKSMRAPGLSHLPRQPGNCAVTVDQIYAKLPELNRIVTEVVALFEEVALPSSGTGQEELEADIPA